MIARALLVVPLIGLLLLGSAAPRAEARQPATLTSTSTPTPTQTPMPTATETTTATATPTATTTTPAPALRLRLPVIARSFAPLTRQNTGLHLGNRLLDWDSPIDFLERVDLAHYESTPRVVVVLSSQVFTIQRSSTAPCAITGAIIGNAYLFDFLDRAIQRGAWVVVRLYPSPGNFADYADPGPNHTLLSGAAPAGPDYCAGRDQQFRATADLAAEMDAIASLVFETHDWPAGSLFFEPANEPNLEWYEALRSANPDLSPAVEDQRAWQAMDAYFAAVYDRAKALNPAIRVLAPPMAQHLFADAREFGTCNRTILIVNGVPQFSAGYDWMQTTFRTKNDGWSWHNYWRVGYEDWRSDFCQTPGAISDHAFQYFPDWLQTEIHASLRPAIITEADLLSPCVFPLNPLTDKEAAAETAESLTRFMSEERAADALAVWILTNQFADPVSGSFDCNDANAEIAWHEAYRDIAVNDSHERSWFPLWWEAAP